MYIATHHEYNRIDVDMKSFYCMQLSNTNTVFYSKSQLPSAYAIIHNALLESMGTYKTIGYYYYYYYSALQCPALKI